MRCEDVIRELAAPSDGKASAALAEHLENCPACAEWSARMASFDRLWAQTGPAEPTDVQWNAVWNLISLNLDASSSRPCDLSETILPVQTPHSSIRISPVHNFDGSNEVLKTSEIQRGIVGPVQSPLLAWYRSKSPRQRIFINYSAAAAAAVYMLAFFSLLRLDHGRLNHPAPVNAPLAYSQVDQLHGGPVEPSFPSTVTGPVDIEEGELVIIRTQDSQRAEGLSEYELSRSEPDDGIDIWYVMFNAIESMANPVVAVR